LPDNELFAEVEPALWVEVLVEPFGSGRTIERTEDVADELPLVLVETLALECEGAPPCVGKAGAT
jgi:hypothetical protein